MFRTSERLVTLVARVTAAIEDGDLPSDMLRWERTYDNDGLTPPRRRELHAMVTALCAGERGGILFVVLPGIDCDGGTFQRDVLTSVAAFAGPAVEGHAEAEVSEGRVLAWHLGHANVGAISAELDLTTCPAGELETDDFRRAVRGPPPEPDTYGFLVMSEAQRRMLTMNAAGRENVRALGTVAGVVAFHEAPHEYVPGARVVVDASGAGFVGSLAVVSQRTAAWARQWGFPHHAVAELVRNALVHRDWAPAVRDRPIRVTITGRRLDVVSPGGLGVKGAHRNPVLRQLARDAGLIHGLGTGLADLADDLADEGKCRVEVAEIDGDTRARLILTRAVEARGTPTKPEAAARTASAGSGAGRGDRATAPPRAAVRATAATAPPARGSNHEVRRAVESTAATGVPSKAVATPASVAAASAPRVPSRPAGGSAPRAPTSTRDDQLLAYVAANGEVSCKRVQDDLGWNRSTTRDVLARLVAGGRLRRTEPDPRSPTQAYVCV
jgi:hypothetical protein